MAEDSMTLRRWAVAVLVALLAGLLVVLDAGPVLAHAALLESVPADGAELDEAPSAVVLQFSEPVGADAARVEVTAPDGRAVEDGPPASSGVSITQGLARLDVAGEYRVTYSVVSEDEHRIEGDLTFTVLEVAEEEERTAGPTEPATEEPQAEATEEAAAGPGVTAAPAPPDVTAAEPAASELPARSWGPWLYALLALAAGAGLAAGLVGRSRAGRPRTADGRIPSDPAAEEPRR